MADPVVISMLYEILVAESKYESRGIDYRAKLKANYHQLLKEHQHRKDSLTKYTKQASHKLVDSLAESVRVLDPTEIQPTDLELVYGTHQYVFPRIPDFANLDASFVAKWHKFYNYLPIQPKQYERRAKRQTEKQKHYPMSKRRNTRESESSSESDEAETKPAGPVLMTEDDFTAPKMPAKPDDGEGKEVLKAQDPGANMPFPPEQEGHVRLPILMNKEVEVTDDSIVFGLMEDEKLKEWASTSSFETYQELYKQLYACDPSLKSFPSYEPDMAAAEAAAAAEKEAQTEAAQAPAESAADKAPKDGASDAGSSSTTALQKAYKKDRAPPPDPNRHAACSDKGSTSSVSGEGTEDLIGTSDFHKKSKAATIPGTYKQKTDNFEADSIFGNYYCPGGKPEAGEAPKEDAQAPASASRRRGGRTRSSSALSDAAPKPEQSKENQDPPANQGGKEAEGAQEPEKDLQLPRVMNLKSFTVNFMEVDSVYSCNTTGDFEVRCSARITEPFISGVMSGKGETTMGVYQELQALLKKLFAIKKRVSGNCSVCSGWNLLHGIAHSFCEFCEDKLVNSSPELLLKIFEIRRYLVSSLYPIVGYKYETLDLFKDGELVEDWQERLLLQKVSIQSLVGVGSSFPKASLHDSRTLPSPVTLPLSICNTINTFQYPKSNTLNSTVTTTPFLNRDDAATPINTPVNHTRLGNALNSAGTVSSSSHKGINSYRGSTNVNSRDAFNLDGADSSDKKLTNFGLMDIVNYRRYYRAKMFNDFFESMFNMYHTKAAYQRSIYLVNNYVNMLKNGLLISSELTYPDNVEDPDAYEDEEAPEKPEPPKEKERGKGNEKKDKSKDSKDKEKGKERGKDKDKGREAKEAKEKDRAKDVKNIYYDEDTSFVLTRLPLDTDMIKLSYYHRGIFMAKSNSLRAYTYIHIAKMFGFKEMLYPAPGSKEGSLNRTTSSCSTLTDQNNEPKFPYTISNDSANSAGSADPPKGRGDAMELDAEAKGANAEEPNDAGAHSSVSNESTTVFFNYNWHELVSRQTNKRQFYLTNNRFANNQMLSNLMNADKVELDPRDKHVGVLSQETLAVLKLLYKYRLLQNMPGCILSSLYSTGKVKIGFPTSLEMYMLSIPDSIMDTSMYGSVGKGFMYSLDTIVHNLALLSTIIRIGTTSSKRRKYKS